MSKRFILGAMLALSAGLAGQALAQQQPAAAPKGKAPAAQQPAQGQQAAAPASAWVKLCEKAPFVRRDKDNKEVKEEKSICLTHHERLDGNTGMVIVSAALRKIEGQDRDHLMVMVPLGMAIAPGLKAAVYTKDLWDKVAKNEKVDEKQLKPMDLKFTICHPAGCTAEIEAAPALVEEMKNGGGIMVLAINASAQPIAFPVPLNGFAQAHAGAAVDNVAYSKAREQLMGQIRQRQQALIEEYRKQQAQAQGGAAAPAAPATTGTAPAKKP
jgi:invasion protein IalB